MFFKKIKLFRELKYFYQRGKKGYCDCDLWDLYEWFTNIFPKMLGEFLNKSNAYPVNGYPPEGADSKFWYKEQKRAWEYEVKKLIWFLREANDTTCSQKNEIEYDVNFDFEEEKEQSWHKLNITFPTKEDEEKSKQHMEREKEISEYKEEQFKKALEQFNKIARNLWD